MLVAMSSVAGLPRPRLLRWTRLAVVAVLVAGCAGPKSSAGPNGSAGSSPVVADPPATPYVPGAIAAIEGANQLIRGTREANPVASAEDLAAIAGADAQFALDLFRELAAGSNENLILGPHSIWTALAMVWAGARGETASEIADVLHFDRPLEEVTPLLNALDLALLSRNDPGVVDLRIANQLFAKPDLPLLDDYLTTMTRDFGAPLAELDFTNPEAARRVINGWAADRTNNRIEELFPEGTITPLTALVLCNAISMDAAWKFLFDPALTSLAPFKLADGTLVEVPTMHFNLYLPLAAEEDFRAVELAYGKGDLSMVLIQRNDLDAFISEVNPAGLQRIFGAITEQGIHLHLPKFSFSSDVDLDDTLQGMGIQTAYGGGADFSGMTGAPGLFLDTVQHEAFIEVDEAGTEAHAATGVAMAASHGPTIIFDKPFLFVIRDGATGAILFLGRVANPLAE
jgi:serpin B